MTTRLNPYLNFRSQAREALEFYHSALGGTIEMMTFADGGMSEGPADADLIMHGAVISEDGLTIFAADTPASMPDPVVGTAVNISLSTYEGDLTPVWDKLTEGAEIVQPFELAPWGDRFGLFNDKFGIAWLVNQGPGEPPA
ncbi:VOC family protein [Aeromicrobium sp. CF4.19]|uniref:VOC family protein n=1 Tax=Aeromicrobium sp. CF4.19 TaxID=3373082 RepID=UPI003EE54094